ncbi:MAG TPA: hypothetical protein VG757_05865 [Devosia sp.]|nr:hypothetical protein [Devosia sp.]
MRPTDYLAPAELYLGSDKATALAQGPRTFRTAAKAISFAVEHAAPVSLRGARLVIGNREFTGPELKAMHRSAAFQAARLH